MSLIETQEELDLVLESALSAKIIAIDTEFYRKTTYFPILSTIQIAFLGSEFIIDCLSDLDFSILKDILEAEEILKIFHASHQDIIALKHSLNINLKNIFDTQIAAMLTGYLNSPSLAELCKAILGITLNKDMQYTNWLKRPLSTKHIDYALLDVKYLEQIYENLSLKIKDLKREDWLLEEMSYLCSLEEERNIWIRINSNPKNIKEYRVLRYLTIWREIEAKKLDISPSLLLSDSVIKSLSIHKIFRNNELDEIFPINQKININEEYRKIKGFNGKVDLKGLLKQVINYICNIKKLPPHLIATQEELISFALNPQDNSKKINKGWRKKLLSNILNQLINI